uniref:Inosine/uridine-preferring nucleoside hydrolase domain-containing protein n=1 Tax=Nothobranchius kuhntae TaxID=321403 RepID=A0A1A8IIZ6_NOTKU
MKKIVLDVDTGVDDAQAIMIALSSPNVEILGITCCHGNTPLDNVLKNTLRVLKVCNRLDIPVYKGASRPILSFCDEWLAQKTAKAEFMRKISTLSMKKARSPEYQKEITAGKGFNPCDVFALAAAVDDGFITESEEVAVTVELNGTHTRGMMVLDYMELLKKDHKVFIMKSMDLEKLKKMLMKAVM